MLSVCLYFAIIQIIVQNNAETRFCNGAANPQCSCTNPSPEGFCSLRCIGKDMCKGSDVKLQCLPNYPCNVECDSAGEENACEDATIDGSLSSELTVICHDRQSCLNAKINCGRGTCRIICISTDSTGSNCKGLQLTCGPSPCSIECDIGSNMCNTIRINTLLATESFECIAPGNNNPNCYYINNQLAPFTHATETPTINTLNPSYNPSLMPTKSPSINPTMPTIYSTHITTNNPSLVPTNIPTTKPSTNPTITPSVFPIISNIPILTPIGTSTVSPTVRPSNKRKPYPTDTPTIAMEPTEANYYVVGELTDGPTKDNVNIYAGQKKQQNDVVGIIFANWLYVAVGSAGIFCCFILMCVKCCRTKRVAPPAVYNPPGAKKKNKKSYKHPQDHFVHVKSSSRATNVNDRQQFLPALPKDDSIAGYSLSINDMKEGLDEAHVALPGTNHGSVVDTQGNIIMDDNIVAYSCDMENKQLIDNQIEDDDVEIMDDKALHVRV